MIIQCVFSSMQTKVFVNFTYFNKSELIQSYLKIFVCLRNCKYKFMYCSWPTNILLYWEILSGSYEHTMILYAKNQINDRNLNNTFPVLIFYNS